MTTEFKKYSIHVLKVKKNFSFYYYFLYSTMKNIILLILLMDNIFTKYTENNL